MRYWLYLCAKLAVALAFLYGLQVRVEHMFKIPPAPWWAMTATPPNLNRPANPKEPPSTITIPSTIMLRHVNRRMYYKQPSMFMHDMPFTFAIIAVWLVSAALLYIVIWDHRRRCRNCFRRLIMPVATGSWGHMFTFGRPATEWICPYGHGTLRIEELQITGRELPDWEAHDDNIWKELESYK